MATVVIEQASNERRLEERERPVVIGGPAAHIAVSDVADISPRAYVGVEGDAHPASGKQFGLFFVEKRVAGIGRRRQPASLGGRHIEACNDFGAENLVCFRYAHFR